MVEMVTVVEELAMMTMVEGDRGNASSGASGGSSIAMDMW